MFMELLHRDRGRHSRTGRFDVKRVALLDFPHAIGPNGSNSGKDTSHFAGVVWRSKQFIHRFTAATVGYSQYILAIGHTGTSPGGPSKICFLAGGPSKHICFYWPFLCACHSVCAWERAACLCQAIFKPNRALSCNAAGLYGCTTSSMLSQYDSVLI